MKNNIGLWIDHRKAVIILHSDDGEEEIREIASHADRQPGRLNGERSNEPFESLQIPADDTKDRRFAHQLNAYYDKVIACVHEAENLLILGPGEAKGELNKRLEKWKPGSRLVTLEITDKMTDRQIAARVRTFFEKARAVIVSK